MGLLYNKNKIFHFPEKLESLPQEVESIAPPLHVRIKPTNVCAHSCWYCAYRFDDVQLGDGMRVKDHIPRDKMMELLDDLTDMGVGAVTFSGGGDPFYYPHFLETVRKIAGGPMKFASLTNGVRLRGELAELFSEYATWVRISVDGWDDESYARYRGVRIGEHTKLMRNLETFSKLGGLCYLGVSLIVDDKNYGHVFEIICRMKDVGAQSVKVSACIIDDDIAKNECYHAPFADSVREQIARAVSELGDEHFEINDAYHLFSRYEKSYEWCPYLQIVPVIGADLTVYSCHDKAYHPSGVLGSIREQRFKTFWMSNKEKFFRIRPCRDCLHHCMVNEQNQLILDYLKVDRGHLEFV